VTGATADLSVRGAPGPLRQALDVLVDNALVHGAGRTEVRVRTTDESVTLGVADGGDGFAAVVLAETNDVHGMGLPLARRLVESCGGRLILAGTGPNPIVELVLVRSADHR
jgi:signal transduction histidine kinase